VRRVAPLVFAVVVVVAAAGGWYAYRHVQDPYRGYAASEVFVEVAPGAGPATIGRTLVAAGVVVDLLAYRIALWQSGAATRLKAGDYRFDQPMTPGEVIAKLARGEVFVRTLTFREGLTLRQMADLFEEHGFGPARDFRDAASDASLVETLDPRATDLEGYLFPETYALTRRSTARDVVTRMVGRFAAVFDEALRAAAGSRHLSIREAVTLASIIEKETARADERPLVSAVYQNRLRLKMGLQCDPTVIYALERAGRYDGNLTRENLRFDSPYNTYRYPGLPPGPIAAPGRASLEAAVHPAEVDYLYFVSRNDGSHVFARTLDEHNRNVRLHQVEFFRERGQARRPGSGSAGTGPRSPGGPR
jgi:UPF0755 protein